MTIKEQYTTMTAEMTVMSPIFIGSGDILNKTKYYFNQNEKIVKIVDEKKFQRFLSKNNLFESFEKHLMTRDEKGNFRGNLISWLNSEDINISTLDIWKYTLETRNLRRKDNNANKHIQLNDIKTFIKGVNGKPYIPGSSIKGAIRTALLYLEISENREKYSVYLQDLKRVDDPKLLDTELSKLADKIEKSAFGDIDNDKFKALRISDSEELEYSDLYIGQRADFAINKKRVSKGMPIIMELLKPGTKIKFSVDIDEQINNGYFSKERIEKALKKFAEFQNMLYKNFASQRNRIEESAEKNKKSCDYIYMPDEISDDIFPNICLGGLSGYWSKTIMYGLIQEKDIPSMVRVLTIYLKKHFDGKKMNHKHGEINNTYGVAPHTMKLAEEDGDFIPVGWARLDLKEKQI